MSIVLYIVGQIRFILQEDASVLRIVCPDRGSRTYVRGAIRTVVEGFLCGAWMMLCVWTC